MDRTAACDLMKVTEMGAIALDVTPCDYEWLAEEYETHWRYFEASVCEKCRGIVLNSTGDAHSGLDPRRTCEGQVPMVEGPMMSCWYPCEFVRTEQEAQDAAVAIVDLPLCVVEVDAQFGLALTSGGMDLSWEICEAFMTLGVLPPVHFATGLPMYADRGTSKRDKWIVAGCLRAFKVSGQRAAWASKKLREALAQSKATQAAVSKQGKRASSKGARRGKK